MKNKIWLSDIDIDIDLVWVGLGARLALALALALALQCRTLVFINCYSSYEPTHTHTV